MTRSSGAQLLGKLELNLPGDREPLDAAIPCFLLLYISCTCTCNGSRSASCRARPYREIAEEGAALVEGLTGDWEVGDLAKAEAARELLGSGLAPLQARPLMRLAEVLGKAALGPADVGPSRGAEPAAVAVVEER